MAKDAVSRVSGERPSSIAAIELAERAAAQFGSIHERWRAAGEVGGRPASAPDTLTVEAPPSEVPRAVDALSATPMLGATDAEAPPAHRPRFKTLIGVPRSSPELDELAGLGPSQVPPAPSDFEASPPALLSVSALPAADAGRLPIQASAASTDGDTRTSEPHPARAAAPPWQWQAGSSAAAQSSPLVSADRSALADSAVDISAEVAALRSVASRRPWSLTLLAAAGILGFFAVIAPRERTVALGWLREAYASRTQSAAQALLPTPAVVELRPSPSGSELTTNEPFAAGPTSDDGAALPGSTEPLATSARPTEVSAEEAKAEHPSPGIPGTGIPGTAVQEATRVQAAMSPRAVEPITSAAKSAVVLAARASPRIARASVASGSRTRPVAATRKRSPRDTALALGQAKPRGTRQNSTRKDGGSGIIRQTPF